MSTQKVSTKNWRRKDKEMQSKSESLSRDIRKQGDSLEDMMRKHEQGYLCTDCFTKTDKRKKTKGIKTALKENDDTN